jgi:hypothetical protein
MRLTVEQKIKATESAYRQSRELAGTHISDAVDFEDQGDYLRAAAALRAASNVLRSAATYVELLDLYRTQLNQSKESNEALS